MVCEAVESEEVVQVACALPLMVSALQPLMLVAPSRKVTVPVGVPMPGKLTVIVAVSTTDSPKTDELSDEATAVVVFALFTVCVKMREVLATKLPSPLYTTVTVWPATLRLAIAVLVAAPPASATGDPKLTPFTTN